MENPSQWLTPQFWGEVLKDTVEWAMVALPRIAIVLVLAWALTRLLDLGLRRMVERVESHADASDTHAVDEQKKRAETLLGIARRTGNIAIACMVVMLVLLQVGVEVAPLIAGAGIVGLAVGFGAQELVRDVISGFFMLFENQVRLGDVAIINGTSGLVERIGLRTICLRDLSGVVHVFQNGKISTLANRTKEWSAMLFEIGVAYKEDTDQVCEVMRDVAEELRQDDEFGPKILEPLELFGVESFGDNAVIIKARLKTVPIQQWAVGREYRRRLKKAFDEKNIEIPFPHRTLYFGEASPSFKVTTEESSRGQGDALPSAPADRLPKKPHPGTGREASVPAQ